MVALRENRPGSALAGLAGALESLRLGPDLADLASDRDRLAAMIRSYLIPRAESPDMPLTVVFAGPTGAGKSTLINSLTGMDLSPAGVVRPTTTVPVVLTSSDNAADYATVGGVSCEVVEGAAAILGRMSFVDTPDIDSTSTGHREIAETLIDNSDVVVFITSALRYADAIPWQTLRRATARGTEVICVLNRVTSATSGAVIDFRSKLAKAGLNDSFITVPEHHLGDDAQRVPSIAVRSLQRRLAGVVSQRAESADVIFERVMMAVVAQTTDLSRRVRLVADDADDLETELSLRLAERVQTLYTGGIGDDLYSPLPEKSGRLALRRWRRVNDLDADEVARREKVVIDRLSALVHGDLRRWLVGETRAVSPEMVLSQVMPAVAQAAEGWVVYVRRIAEEISTTDMWLAEAVLIDAASDEEDSAAANQLWREHAPMLVGRARRELVGRLEVVYQHTAGLVAELASERRSAPDDSDLRSALGAVTSLLAPVHA